MHGKQERLKDILRSYGKVAIAFSGGVDSSYLLKAAYDVLGIHVLAVTATSESFPQRELEEAKAFAQRYGIRHVVIGSEELDIHGFAQNPLNRCYLCKRELYGKIKRVAKENGITVIAEASNADDLNDYRPGLKAVAEAGVKSPLREAGLTKVEIRLLSREMGMNTWNKPSFACLASRFPYGETITREKLTMVDKAEQYLLDHGFTQVRVRHHGDVARMELLPDEIGRLLNGHLAEDVYRTFKGLGFTFSAVDIMGYRMGSMNEGMHKDSGASNLKE